MVMKEQLDLGVQTAPEFDISIIFTELWRHKVLVILLTGLFAVASVLFALSKPNIYRSEAVLTSASAKKTSGLSSLANQFGGLANLAGINLGGGGSVHVVLEQLQSKDFLTRFIRERELVIPLFAATGWDPAEQKLLYEKPDIYDFEAKKWIREVNYPLRPEPSDHEAYELFLESYHVEMDRKTKIIKVWFEFLSPELAQQWLTWLLADFNDYVRAKDIKEFAANMEYLQDQIQKTNIAEMQTVFYSLVEEQTKQSMLAEVQEEYAVRVVDSPSSPSKKSAPRRAMIAIAGTMLGGMLATAIVLFMFFRRQSNLNKA